MGNCIVREMGLENVAWTQSRTDRVLQYLKEYREKEQALNLMLDQKVAQAKKVKELREKAIDKEIRR